MKKYVKPMMESESFVANEYISACGDINSDYVCVDMGTFENIFTSIILDENRNGVRDLGEDTNYNDVEGIGTIGYGDDCGMNGGTMHNITDPSGLDMVLIYFNADANKTPNYTPAYAVPNTNGNPHFVTVKTYNHS